MLRGWPGGTLRLGQARRDEVKNILVLTEYFTAGGLETQLRSQARSLGEHGIRMHLATSSPRSDLAENAFASALYDLPMQTSAGIFLETISKVEALVDEFDIDLIHAHPFFSFMVGMVVAQRRKLPLVSTLHGPSSISLGGETIYDILFQKALLPRTSLLIAVSPEVEFLARAAAPCMPVVLPNAVQVNVSAPPAPDPGLPWVWAGRLDHEKIVGLRALIAEVLRLKRNTLHIYGEGPEVEALRKQLAEEDPQSEWVAYKGWDDNFSDNLSSYSLVAGMGRVLLEGAAASRPCLLVGYDGIKGIMSEADMEQAAAWNFSGRGLRSITPPEFEHQLHALQQSPQQFLHYEWVKRYRSAEVVWEEYRRKLYGLKPFAAEVVEDFIGCLKYSGSSGIPVWGDNRVYVILGNLNKFRDEIK